MGHSNIRIKVRRRKVAILAAKSKQFDVKNHMKKMPEVVQHKLHCDYSGAITCPFTNHKFVPTNPHPIPGRFGITITGYDWVEPEGKLWVIPEGGFKQPKQLRKKYKKKYYNKGSKDIRKIVEHSSDYDQFKNYPYTIPKMPLQVYMEKLIGHKLVRWIRKNPAPVKQDDLQQDLFESEFMLPWTEKRMAAEKRFRDLVVSKYDKLPLIGRFRINKSSTASYQESMIAEIKDINGEGHRVNDLDPKKSELMKTAQSITNNVHAKNDKLVCTNLFDHKRKRGRILLPKAA